MTCGSSKITLRCYFDLYGLGFFFPKEMQKILNLEDYLDVFICREEEEFVSEEEKRYQSKV